LIRVNIYMCVSVTVFFSTDLRVEYSYGVKIFSLLIS